MEQRSNGRSHHGAPGAGSPQRDATPAIDRRRVIMWALAAVGGVCSMSAGQMALHILRTRRLHATLATRQHPNSGARNVIGRDFAALKLINPNVAGWLDVPDLDISLPVVQERVSNASSTYLTHDFWGNMSPLGCPYIDVRSSARGPHTLIYGHHDAALPDAQFGPLHDAHDPAAFNKIRNVVWETPERGSITFKPLVGLRVQKDYTPIQVFPPGWAGDPAQDTGRPLRETAIARMLAPLARDASARATVLMKPQTAAFAVREIGSILTLVTCSSLSPGTPWRTLLVCGGP